MGVAPAFAPQQKQYETEMKKDQVAVNGEEKKEK